jgi:hypothetical protein
VNDLFIVILVSILGIFGLFIGFIINHEREHKKEIRKTRNNKGSDRQHNKSGDDVKTTAPTTSTAPAKA